MKFKYFFLLITLFLFSCSQNMQEKKALSQKEFLYEGKGFVLLYNKSLIKDELLKKKLNNDKLQVIHSSLSKNTLLKIINPINSQSIVAKVIANDSYPEIFKIVVSEKIFRELGLKPNNPYVEIFEFRNNKTFIAKESKIFDEEKTVITKVPVDKIIVKDLSIDETANIITDKKFFYSIVIADFYYLKSAESLKSRIIKESGIDNLFITKITSKKFRLSTNKFKDFDTLKKTYINLNKMGFSELDVVRN